MKIDYEKLKQDCGLDFSKNGKYKEQDFVFYVGSILYNLKTHNKNYTKEQYERILQLNDIWECIKGE